MNHPSEISPKSIIEDDRGTTVLVYPERLIGPGSILFFSFWLVLALYLTHNLTVEIFGTDDSGAGSFVYAVFILPWIYGTFSIFRFLLWQLKGREEITITNDSLLIAQNFWLFTQKKSFTKDHIRKMQIYAGKKQEFNWYLLFPGKHGRIVFNYGDEQYWFGSMGSVGEAERVLLTVKRKVKGK